MCCKTITTWKYDHFIGHSRCMECGWHHIPTLDPDHLYEKEERAYLDAEKEKHNTPEYKALKDRHKKEKEHIKMLQSLCLTKEELDKRHGIRKRK